MTYDEWFTQYMALYKGNLKPRTKEDYLRIHRSYVSPLIGSMELAAITPEDVQRVLIAVGGSRQAQVVYTLLHAVFRRACRSRLVGWSAVEAVDKPEHDPEAGKQLTDADLAAAEPFIRGSLGPALALYAGLRRGEIAGLQFGDVDLAGGILRIRRQIQRVNGQLLTITPKSGAGIRDVPISPELLPILRRAYQLRPHAQVIPYAPEYSGRQWARIQTDDVTLSQSYRLHDLRHTYGSRLILAGANIRVVSYLMGHSSLEVTVRVYSHCDAQQAAREVRRVYAGSLQ